MASPHYQPFKPKPIDQVDGDLDKLLRDINAAPAVPTTSTCGERTHQRHVPLLACAFRRSRVARHRRG